MFRADLDSIRKNALQTRVPDERPYGIFPRDTNSDVYWRIASCVAMHLTPGCLLLTLPWSCETWPR